MYFCATLHQPTGGIRLLRWQAGKKMILASTLFQEAHDYCLMGLAAFFAGLTAYFAVKLHRRSAMREVETQFRVLAEAIPQIVWTAGPDGQTTYINQRWYEMTGVEESGCLACWVDSVHPDDRVACHEKWVHCVRTGETFEVEYRLRDAKRGYRWYLDRATPMRDSSGAIVKWFGTCTDIDDHKKTEELLEQQVQERTVALSEANARLQQESVRDPLTGLYNRRYLEERLEQETRRAVRAHGKLGFLMLDLDHFKRFNDTYGHDAGDIVLRQTARSLQGSIRAEDAVCRFGGEEFVILLPMADLKTSQARAEQIRGRLRKLRIEHDGRALGHVTVSIGVSALPGHGTTGKELLQVADAALYRAKSQGRDCVVVAMSPSSDAQENRSTAAVV